MPTADAKRRGVPDPTIAAIASTGDADVDDDADVVVVHGALVADASEPGRIACGDGESVVRLGARPCLLLALEPPAAPTPAAPAAPAAPTAAMGCAERDARLGV